MPHFSPFIKMTIITLATCVPQRREETNEMSVKGFELSRIKRLWLYKVQSSILSLYFSWHLPQSLKFIACHWLLLLTSLSLLVIARAVLENHEAAAVFYPGLSGLFHLGHGIWHFFFSRSVFLCMLDCFAVMEPWVSDRRTNVGNISSDIPKWHVNTQTILLESRVGMLQNFSPYRGRKVDPAKMQSFSL